VWVGCFLCSFCSIFIEVGQRVALFIKVIFAIISWLLFNVTIFLAESAFLTTSVKPYFLVDSISHLTRHSVRFLFFAGAAHFHIFFLITHLLRRYVVSSMFPFILQGTYCSVLQFVWFLRCSEKITHYSQLWNLKWFPWWLPYSLWFAVYFKDNRWRTLPVVFGVVELSSLVLTSIFLNLSLENDNIYLSIKHTCIIDIL